MLKPLDNRVLIRLLPPQESLLGKFDIPTSSQKIPNRGDVVGVGDSVTEIKVGDIAIFDEKFGVVITEKGENFRVIDKRDIFAIIKK